MSAPAGILKKEGAPAAAQTQRVQFSDRQPQASPQSAFTPSAAPAMNYSAYNSNAGIAEMAARAERDRMTIEAMKNQNLTQQQQGRVNKLVLNSKDLTAEESKNIRDQQKQYALSLLNIKSSELKVKKQAVDRAKRLERHDENDRQYRRVLALEPVRVDQIMARIREKDNNFINRGDTDDYARLATSMQKLRSMKDRLYAERIDRYQNEYAKIDDFDKFNEIGQRERENYDRRDSVRKYIQGTFYDTRYKDPDLYVPIGFGDSAGDIDSMQAKKRKIFRTGLGWYTAHYACSALFMLMGLFTMIGLAHLYGLEYHGWGGGYPEWTSTAVGVLAFVSGIAGQVLSNRRMNKSKDPSLRFTIYAVVLGAVMLGAFVAAMTERYANKSERKFNVAKHLCFASILLYGFMLFGFFRAIYASKTTGNLTRGQVVTTDLVLFFVAMLIASSFSIPIIFTSDSHCHSRPQHCFKKLSAATKKDIASQKAFYGSEDQHRLQKCTANLPDNFLSNLLTRSVLETASKLTKPLEK